MKIFSNKNKEKTGKKGFTLVETLVAVAIFSVSIAAVISVSASGIASTTNSKNRLTATFLAQEDIEYIRHLRNKYTEAPGVNLAWSDFVDLITPCSGGVICTTTDLTLDDPVVPVTSCLNQVDCSDRPVYLDRDSANQVVDGYYYQADSPGTSNSGTPFLRYFTTVIDPAHPDEIIVTTTVRWQDRNSSDKNITLTEILTNWLPVAGS